MRRLDKELDDALNGRSFLLFDGAMGTMLQEAGMAAGQVPELLNFSHPALVERIHRAYVEAGSRVVSTNTFGANARKLEGKASVRDVYTAAVRCARAAGAPYVAADIGPTGALLEPLGTLSFDEAYALFAEQARAAQESGCDLILVETQSDLLEAKAAVLACRENSELPVLATMTFGEDGRTFLGTTPEAAAITLGGLGVSALGINCSLGPDALAGLLRRMAPYAHVPLMVQANAGLPHEEDDRTVYDIGPEEYARAAEGLLDAGATIVGGCCGTDPRHIALLSELLARRTPGRPAPREDFCVCSAQRHLALSQASHDVAVIGERINPTGKKRLKEALRNGDFGYVVEEALSQREAGADLLDVNAGLPELDEPAVLGEVVKQVQAVCDLPLQIDSTDPAAIERAVRLYAGKALVNSVNGSRESLSHILPIAARYGCAVVGLSLDESGIPTTAEGRVAIARRIVDAAVAAGIPREDVVIDCLAMAASTDQGQVQQIVQAIRRVKDELGVKTVLGVSNISFGLPQRDLVNAVFTATAFGAGLDLVIMNPLSPLMSAVVATQRELNAQDAGCAAFIGRFADMGKLTLSPASNGPDANARALGTDAGVSTDGACGIKATEAQGAAGAPEGEDPLLRMHRLIVGGRKGQVGRCATELLADHDPLDIINRCFIPALDEVGAKFEAGTFFLPQLMASAEAVKAGFDVVRAAAPASMDTERGSILVATVKGDIHDIGKNIVKMLLENYGYRVYDLGRDVSPEAVLEAVQDRGVRLVGLSALMTTTVRSMEETIDLLHRNVPDCKVMVGGAVLNEEYAAMIGADYYAKDAAAAAKIASAYFAETGRA